MYKYSMAAAVLFLGMFLFVLFDPLKEKEPEEIRAFKEKYKRINNGMTKEEVEGLVGKPHEVREETREIRASRQGPASESVLNEMFVRESSEIVEGLDFIIVYFDKHGLVVGKRIDEFCH